MADSHNSEHHEGLKVRDYLVVFGALSIFTAISFAVNHYVGRNTTGLFIILAVAVCKAVLVGMYFMHLILDWSKFYFLIFPAFILGTMMLVVFLPDIVIAWHYIPAPGTVAPSGP
jgi:caa(3)-type oxidase subunit IV